LALNPAVNAPNIPCFKSPLLPIMPNKLQKRIFRLRCKLWRQLVRSI
jgi:hypothetical protein